MDASRIRQLNQHQPVTLGKSIIYVMSRDQRIQDNHALLTAQEAAIQQKLPLFVFFNLLPSSGYRSREQFEFMLEGLQEVADTLSDLGIHVVMRSGDAVKNIFQFALETQPSAVYFDFSPLHGPRKVHQDIAQKLTMPVYEVDTHNVVPVWAASDHQEFAAHTFRPKVHKLLAAFLIEPPKINRHPFRYKGDLPKGSQPEVSQIAPTGNEIHYKSGEKAAHEALHAFLSRLDNFAIDRNNPTKDALSNLSPYLHFGQISSLRVALEVLRRVSKKPLLFSQAKMAQHQDNPSLEDGMNALLEEMIVRKELSDNFCFYAPHYKDFSGIAAWARTTLDEHRKDNREFTYTRYDWESADTHDPAWNAAQQQMMQTGKMHGYMRMYWAKKMLEWSASPEEALADCIYLNDKYSLDGGDPNGYVGILWSIGGLHDRPWTERPVFGKIRYMNYMGLKRKFDIERYITTWNKQKKLI